MRDLYTSAIIGSLTIFAFGGSRTPQTGPQHEMPMPGMSMTMPTMTMQNCPMKLAGADLAVADSPDGVTLTITTQSGDVAELRRRTESMAKMHNEGMMPFSFQYEEVPNGARLSLTPKDPARLEDLRTKVFQHAEQMKNGGCSMMEDMMMGTHKAAPQMKRDDTDHSTRRPLGKER